MYNVDLGTAIGEWLADLELSGRQAGTRLKHQLEVERLSRWCEEDDQVQNWQQLTRRDLQRYTRLRAGLSHSTRSNMLCSLRVFFRWCVEQEYIPISPAAGFKTPIRPEPLPRALSTEELRRLIAYLQEQEGTRARRDEAMLLTGLYAGMRASELARLTWPAVDLDGRVFNIRIAKMNHGRAVKIHAVLVPVLAAWRELQGLDDTAPVFSLDGKPIKATRVGKVCRRIALATGLPLTSHALRHSFATWAIRKGGDLYAVSRSLGHRRLEQTKVYIAADGADSAPAVDSLPGLDSW
jgi:site-specific recombinase XerC